MYERGDYKWSITEYSKSIEADPKFMMARLNRAANYMKLRDFEAAIFDLDHIIK